MPTTEQHNGITIAPKQGLSQVGVAERIARGERNRYDARVGRTYREILRYNIFTVFNAVLFVLLLLVILLQDYTTVVFAGFSVTMNALIGTIQEINAKRRLNQLADLAPKEVTVWREGKLQTILNSDVVKDDHIVLQPGDMVVVDGEIISIDSLEIDESQLTGESEPVVKAIGQPIISGSFCVAGSGIMVAQKVGRHSKVNQMAASARAFKNPITPTQRRINIIVQFTLVVMAVCLPMLIFNNVRTGTSFLEINRNAIVFVTSLVPQGLILIVILSLTIGAVKISRHQTLVQRVNAVESMANVTVLCFDKTGTLTHNRLAVADVLPLDKHDMETVINHLRAYMSGLSHYNSTAAAVMHYLDAQGTSAGGAQRRTRQSEIPFTSGRKWGAVTWDDETLVFGAPERVLGRSYAARITDYTRHGLRVLALGRLPQAPQSNAQRLEAEPLALLTIHDEMREDIEDTLSAFIQQGVQPKVISGDSLETVRAVARKAGMKTGVAYTGDELRVMSESDFDQAVLRAEVFARVEPDTKQDIIQALRRQGEYVAMVGDGVNDVLALKAADLAVAMNAGAQISKDIADIVLLNNSLSTLPLALGEGTEITQTLYGTTKMFLAKDTYNTLLFLFTLLLALPFPITPIQISWASFGTTNMAGGLIALGILRPARIKNFREDVLDYIIIGGVMGAVVLAFSNMVIVSYTDAETGRYAMTLAVMLYQLNILWNIGGIDLWQPRTIINNPLVVVISGVLCVVAIGAALAFPDIFEFALPPAEVIVFVLLIHLLLITLVSVGLRNRDLLHRFYTLTER